MRICADDGSRGGFPIGWVVREPHAFRPGRLAWNAYARRAVNDPGYWNGRVRGRYEEYGGGGEENIDKAVHEVLYAASFGDVLAARAAESRAADTYAGTIDEAQAEWLGSLDVPKGMTHLGGGRIRFTAIAYAYFRGGPESGPFIEEVGGTPLLHLDPLDEPYRLTRER
ncbi:hypothetical protein [Streptomyces sp. SID10815]|uniref:hypothetical protein n=1 Tax=Streptomyces sp. SID10815 TaxID=2706027 RepID=UPI0013CCAA2E|nr:hypothetical protein [Streptomyces sp. SID10815]NEA48094.1 hypothetical protein [Streptomyces sp. SID10815]